MDASSFWANWKGSTSPGSANIGPKARSSRIIALVARLLRESA